MHRNSNITGTPNSTFHNAGILDFRHLQRADFQYLFRCENIPYFTGKEKDSETGFYYFGARYYDPSLSGLFLSVDPMSDKYPSVSPYAYCAWNPVKLVDPDGDTIKIIGDEQFRKKTYDILLEIKKSGKAGETLVNAALQSKNSFAIIQPNKCNESQERNTVKKMNQNVSTIIFDFSNGTYDESNGGVLYTGISILAHELSHFIFPSTGKILLNNKNTGIAAGEVNAVEWENMVRRDCGLPLRKKYGGLDVYGFGITPNKKYPKHFDLIEKRDYMSQSLHVSGRQVHKVTKKAQTYYIGGRYVNTLHNWRQTNVF